MSDERPYSGVEFQRGIAEMVAPFRQAVDRLERLEKMLEALGGSVTWEPELTVTLPAIAPPLLERLKELHEGQKQCFNPEKTDTSPQDAYELGRADGLLVAIMLVEGRIL